MIQDLWTLILLAVILLSAAALAVRLFVRWLRWRTLPKPEGYEGEIVVDVMGREWRIYQEWRSPVDDRLLGFKLVNHYGSTRTTTRDLYDFRDKA